MRILVSNDDGYQAEGIQHLAKAMSSLGETYIVAPDRNRSGASNSLTLDMPLTVKQFADNAYYVNGTPTDCVHLAIGGIMPFQPDIVVSGINDGANLGDDVLYSGTIAAATEGRSLGYPAIAISLNGNKHFETAAHVAKTIVNRLQSHPLPASTILSINVPDVPLSDLGNYEITRLGMRYPSGSAAKEISPRGKEIYWIGLPGDEQDAGPGTDFCALRNGHVSITPLKIDLTHYDIFENLSLWFSNMT